MSDTRVRVVRSCAVCTKFSRFDGSLSCVCMMSLVSVVTCARAAIVRDRELCLQIRWFIVAALSSLCLSTP